ncbi:transglycosylase SLT domain-containing protein [Thermodesulfobacteriota bacterium B35]
MLPGRHYPILLLVLLLLPVPVLGAKKGKETFPVYSSIRTNVRFWEQVYGRYTTTQGILHDKNDLNIIYTVVDLVDWETPGAARINRKLIKLARQRYKAILTRLGSGKKPATREERHVASLFPKRRHSVFLKARDNIRLQIGQKDRFRQGVIRSGAYLRSIKNIFRTYGLPRELAYLPHVESSFNPKAHSKAGAAGLWQFTSSTGRQYLTINDVLDERYDPLRASHAAARLLKENYALLGTWPLALTAYNYGRNGMLRALKEKKNYENIFRFHRKGRFKFASRNFYPEFLAAMRVARKLERDRSIILDRPRGTVTVRLKGYAPTRELRSYFGVSARDFALLNPALRRPVLEGRKHIPRGYLLRLPATAVIRQKVARMGSRFYRSRQIRDRIYIVRRGDTAGAIARRYNLSLKELKLANNLDRKGRIRAGQRLKIPGPAGSTDKSIIVLRSRGKRRPG